MRSNVRFISMLCAAALSTAAFAQSSSSSSSGQTTADSMRQPGGLYDATLHTRAPEVSIWGIVQYWPGIGIGGRYFHPIVPDGFLPELNDSFEIGGGIDFFPIVIYWGGVDVVVPVEARWTFHLMPNLAAYAKVSIGIDLSFGSAYYGLGHGNLDFWNSAGPGIIYQLSDKMSFQAELTYRGFRGGIAFVF
jgi:hypothetical protein